MLRDRICMNVFTPNVAYYVIKYERMKGSGYVDTKEISE
jgi:hypothetical protein